MSPAERKVLLLPQSTSAVFPFDESTTLCPCPTSSAIMCSEPPDIGSAFRYTQSASVSTASAPAAQTRYLPRRTSAQAANIAYT